MKFTTDELIAFYVEWTSLCGVTQESADSCGDTLCFHADGYDYEAVATAGSGIDFYVLTVAGKKLVSSQRIPKCIRWILSEEDCNDMQKYIKRSKEFIKVKVAALERFENFIAVHCN